MPIRPSDVEIDGKTYLIAHDEGEEPYQELFEKAVVRQPEIPGSSRAAKTLRPDVLSWKLDDWSGGEGQRHFDSNKPETADRFFRSGTTGGGAPPAAVDVSEPGQIKLGKLLTSSLALGSVTARGPQLVTSRGDPWVVWDSTVRHRTADPDTWTARTVGFDAGGVSGPIEALGGYILIGERGAGGEIHAVLTTGAFTDADFSAEPAESPIFANNRVFALRDLATTVPSGNLLKYDPTAAKPITGTVAGVVLGTIGFSNPVTLGPDVYFVAQNFEGEPGTLFRYSAEDAALSERAKLPVGFRINTNNPYRVLAVLNDVIFVAGWYDDGQLDVATVLYFTADTSGTIGRIRKDVNMQATCLAARSGNELLIGTNRGTVFLYDMARGGISVYAFTGSTTDLITSMTQASGRTYVATLLGAGPGGTGTVLRTNATVGGDAFISTVDVESPVWDFDLPEELKILHEIEIKTLALPANTDIQIQVQLDDATTITTEANGANMIHDVDGATSRVFRLSSSAGSERTFKFMKVIVQLNTSNSASSPTLLSVAVRAIPTGKIKFFQVILDVDDESSTHRKVGQQLTAKKKIGTLRTLRDSVSNLVFTFKPLLTAAQAPHAPFRYDPSGLAVSEAVVLDEMSIVGRERGKSRVRLKLRKIDG